VTESKFVFCTTPKSELRRETGDEITGKQLKRPGMMTRGEGDKGRPDP
jgi:hypothetical protein